MPRPRTKDADRLDTRVRLAERHVTALDAYEAEHGPGQRNAVIERALDRFFGLKEPARPRLLTGNVLGEIGPESPVQTRVGRQLPAPSGRDLSRSLDAQKTRPATTKGRAAPRPPL